MRDKAYITIFNQCGFGIIEVMAGIAIIGVLIGVILISFSHGVAISSSVRHRLKAMHIASGNLDRAVQKLYINFNWNGTISGDPTFEQEDDYLADIRLEDITVLGNINAKKIISTITWTEDGVNQSVSFTTSFYRVEKDLSGLSGS